MMGQVRSGFRRIKVFHASFILILVLLAAAPSPRAEKPQPSPEEKAAIEAPGLAGKILAGARREAALKTRYVEEYHVLQYPGGDVPAGTGVCTDLIVRALRNAGVDLQQALHEDRVAHPEAYPTQIWSDKKADASIDHRRCQNLAVWFKRHARSLPTALDEQTLQREWQAGDVVFFVRPGQSHPWHVAIVSDRHCGDAMPLIIDGFPPATSETHRLDEFQPIHSHFRLIRVSR